MPYVSFASQAVTVIQPGFKLDSRRNQIDDWDHPERVFAVANCVAQPGAAPETLGGRDTTEIAYTLFTPANSGISARCAIEIDGVKYMVDGEPLHWKSPTGKVSHDVLALKAWK